MKSNPSDSIVVGAGLAGCVLANHLAARRDLQVVLLQAGGPPVAATRIRSSTCAREQPDASLRKQALDLSGCQWP